jgi:hypothetical protein
MNRPNRRLCYRRLCRQDSCYKVGVLCALSFAYILLTYECNKMNQSLQGSEIPLGIATKDRTTVECYLQGLQSHRPLLLNISFVLICKCLEFLK